MARARENARTPEAIEKRAAPLRGKPWKLSAAAQRKRLAGIRRCHNAAWRAKMSAILKAKGHRPPRQRNSGASTGGLAF